MLCSFRVNASSGFVSSHAVVRRVATRLGCQWDCDHVCACVCVCVCLHSYSKREGPLTGLEAMFASVSMASLNLTLDSNDDGVLDASEGECGTHTHTHTHTRTHTHTHTTAVAHVCSDVRAWRPTAHMRSQTSLPRMLAHAL